MAEAKEQVENISVTAQQLECIKTKAVEDAIAKYKEKAEIENKIAENSKVMSTQEVMDKRPWYKVIIRTPSGYDKVKSDVISVNGVKFKFTYNEPVILPECAVKLLENSKTVVGTRTVDTLDADGVKGIRVLPKYGQKRMFEKTLYEKHVTER